MTEQMKTELDIIEEALKDLENFPLEITVNQHGEWKNKGGIVGYCYDYIRKDAQQGHTQTWPGKFQKGDRVRKKGNKGQWHGHIVGFYSTECTPIGYAVESEREENSVQIYPESALEPFPKPPSSGGA